MLAVVAANIPFINERLFAVIPVKLPAERPEKPLWLRLLELFILYMLIGGCANLLEARIGNVANQGWEFFAITACLFIVLAYPGFVYRYLRKRHP